MAWEYLEIRHATGSIMHIWPPDKLNLQWLSHRYDKAKIQLKNWRHVAIVSLKNDGEGAEAFHLLVEHVCAEGWEPFAREGDRISFKRQVQDKDER